MRVLHLGLPTVARGAESRGLQINHLQVGRMAGYSHPAWRLEPGGPGLSIMKHLVAARGGLHPRSQSESQPDARQRLKYSIERKQHAVTDGFNQCAAGTQSRHDVFEKLPGLVTAALSIVQSELDRLCIGYAWLLSRG